MEQRSKEWLNYRKNKIGASDAPILMGVSPYKTPLQLYEEKILGKEQRENEGMRFGSEKEPLILAMVEKKLKKKFSPDVLESKVYPWMIASLDGISKDKQVLEIKCNDEETHAMVAKGIAPAKHFPQIQHQCFVANVSKVLYASYHKDDLQLLEIPADEAFQKALIAVEEDFWNRLQTYDAPEPTDRDALCKDSDQDFLADQTMLGEWVMEIARLQNLVKAKKKELISSAEGRSIVTRIGRITKYLERGRVDYEAIPELQGVNLDGYRGKPVEKWRFSFAESEALV